MNNATEKKASQADIVVIGGGIAGMSVAAELASHHSVVLLEREPHPGYHATGRSAAYFSPAYGNAVVRALTDASEHFYKSPPSGFSDTQLLQPREALHIAPKGEEDRLTRAIDGISSLRPLTADKALTTVPVLSEHYLGAAALEVGGGDLDVDAILMGYRKQFQRASGELRLHSDVQSIRRANGQFTIAVQGREGVQEINAAVVINAAGAWADTVATLCGLTPLGLQPKRRTAFLIKPQTEHRFDRWPLVINQIDPLYFKPDAGNLLVSPMDETPDVACDAAPDELDIALAAERLERTTSIKVERVAHRWAGLRTFAEDDTFVVGFDPQLDGFFWLAGQGGYGVQTAPALSQMAAALVNEHLGEKISRSTDQWAHEQDLSPARLGKN